MGHGACRQFLTHHLCCSLLLMFLPCSSVGSFPWAAVFQELLQIGSSPWDTVLHKQTASAWVPHGLPVLPENLLLRGFFSIGHSSYQEPALTWDLHWVRASFRAHPLASTWGPSQARWIAQVWCVISLLCWYPTGSFLLWFNFFSLSPSTVLLEHCYSKLNHFSPNSFFLEI